MSGTKHPDQQFVEFVAKAMRTLLRGVGTKNNARVNLKIVDPKGLLSKGSENGTFNQGFFRSQNS